MPLTRFQYSRMQQIVSVDALLDLVSRVLIRHGVASDNAGPVADRPALRDQPQGCCRCGFHLSSFGNRPSRRGDRTILSARCRRWVRFSDGPLFEPAAPCVVAIVAFRSCPKPAIILKCLSCTVPPGRTGRRKNSPDLGDGTELVEVGSQNLPISLIDGDGKRLDAEMWLRASVARRKTARLAAPPLKTENIAKIEKAAAGAFGALKREQIFAEQGVLVVLAKEAATL